MPNSAPLIGQTILHYCIIEKLGGGGMGVVYKAEDTKLHRYVALKFLPDGFAPDSQALNRFNREAQAASALNHPNICTIYEIGEHDGQPFIAMEFLDGQTLKHLIGGRSLAPRQVLELGIEIADALETAHAEGIIHRDIKPANIFLTKLGHAKILDFGLAKVVSAGTSGAASQMPTTTGELLTRPGSTMGTLAYMSPEQARGEELDARTDLFSFGAVLYEMAAGQMAFTGSTTAIVHDAILNRAPVPVARLRPELPSKLEEIIGKSLEKDRKLRYQSAAEIRTDLQRLKRDSESSRAAESTGRHSNWLKIGVWMLGGTVLAFLGFFAVRKFWPRSESAALTPVPFTAYPGQEHCPTFSPDGSQIAFAWNVDPESGSKGFDLYVKVIGSENLLRLTHHPSEALCPAWSPDGTQIAFHRISGADTGIYLVPALGGPERKLRSTHIPFRGSTPISWSPDGKRIAYQDFLPPASSPRVLLLSLETLESRQIPHDDSCLAEWQPVFSHSGERLAYGCLLKTSDNEIGIYSVPSWGGPSIVVTRFMTGWGWPQGIAWTANDKKLILSRPQTGDDFELDEVSVANGTLRKLPIGQDALRPAISAKGDKLAYEVLSTHRDIWRRDLSHPEAAAVKLISSTRDQDGPQYSPDGKHIAFTSNRGGTWEIWMSDADGTHLVQMSDLKSSNSGTPRWSPDSQRIAFDSRQSGHPEVYIVNISERTPRKVVTNVSEMSTPTWSHDGKWLYFQASTSRAPVLRIFRCPVSGGDAVALSADFRSKPSESYDGNTLYFASEGGPIGIYGLSLKSAGAESVLKGMPVVAYPTQWTVASEGIYFVPADAPKSIRYFDFATKQVHRIFESEKGFGSGLSVSPDGRWILYTQQGEDNSDIMLVGNFR